MSDKKKAKKNESKDSTKSKSLKKNESKDLTKSKSSKNESKDSEKNEITVDDESSDTFEILDSDDNSDLEDENLDGDLENLEDDDDLLDEKDNELDEYEVSESQNISKSNLDDDDDEDDVFEYIDPDEDSKTENLRVPDDERTTIPRLTKYEKVRILGTRIKQISDGSKIFVKSKDIKNASSIADLELKHKVIPLKIKRPLPDGRYEIWSVNELSVVD